MTTTSQPSPRLSSESPPEMSEQHYHEPHHDLPEMIHRAFARSPIFAGRQLSVEVRDDAVTLRGVVKSYYHKQLAQESIRAIEGINQVHNELKVVSG